MTERVTKCEWCGSFWVEATAQACLRCGFGGDAEREQRERAVKAEAERDAIKAELAECQKRATGLAWAVEYTLQLAEGLQRATPDQIQEWLVKAREILTKKDETK